MTKTSTLEGGWNGPRVQVIAPHDQCLRWVIRVVLTVHPSLPIFAGKQTFQALVGMSQRCHVWTAPAVQEESDVSAKRSGAAMYPAFECGHFGCWP